MAEVQCRNCHKTIKEADTVVFCPFCGERLSAGGPDLKEARQEQDPVKKHEMLLKLREQYPESLEVAEEILYLGRLYDRGKKGLDFSVIKCYVLNVYLDPKAIKRDRREELRKEIFNHPDLDRCLALAEDKDVFLRRYLERISEEFVRLFLKGSTLHMHSFFGFINTSKAPKHLAVPAARMIADMLHDEGLTEEQRKMLAQAFYAAFARQLEGNTQYLDAELARAQISLDSQ